MSDETPVPQGSHPASDEISMDTEIEFEGRTYTLSDLMQAQSQMRDLQGQVDRLNEFKQSTVQLMSGAAGDEQRMQAARVILSESGYSAPEIEKYMSEYQNALSMPEEEYSPEQEEEVEGAQMPLEETSEMNYEDTQARQEAARTSEEFRQYRLSMLQREMQSGIHNALDTNKDVEVLLGRLKTGDNSEAFEKARGSLEQQVHDRTLKMLQDRKAREGNFNEAWVQDTAKQATEEVLGTYRTVIGDIDSIGRAPETVSGEPTLASKPPVPEPEFKPGMDRGTVDASVKEWNTDVLSRLAEDTSTDGESKA